MPTITVKIKINAPVARVFDLARDIGVHCRTAAHTKERAVDGVTDGLICLDEEVTFEAVHLGIRQRLQAKIVEFDYPRRFVDEMLKGAFKAMRHVHEFEASGDGTLMTDTVTWISPFGFLGVIADKLVLERHMRGFIEKRNEMFKGIAETPPAA